jgi:arylsulfatase A-like enzyme
VAHKISSGLGWIFTFVIVCTGCGRTQPDSGPPNILLISIDALRADHLSCYGHDRHTTPTLDGLAARGTRFSKAFVNTHGTPPSHATLLSSLYQESHRVGIDSTAAADQGVPIGLEMIQEILAGAGWQTVAVTGGGFMSARFGFGRGFDVYIDNARSVRQGAELLRKNLRRLCRSDRPVFVFFHTYQVHSPYWPPRRFRRLFGEHHSAIDVSNENLLQIQARAVTVLTRDDFEYLEALYDGEIRFTDEVLGRLLDFLDTIGFLDHAVVVVTADHGEEFGEHGGLLHGGKLFDELLHVPLIITGAGVDHGVVNPALVSLIDVAPTLLSLSGLEVPATMEGRNILGRNAIGSWHDQRIFAQYGSALYCVRTPRWKLIQRTANGKIRLFDLHRDEREKRDLSGRHPELAAALLEELVQWRAQRPRLDLVADQGIELPEETAEELRALGYVK